MNVHVNGNCIGCGLCVSMCGAVFLMTEEGVAAAKDTIYPDQEGFVQEARGELPSERHRGRRIAWSERHLIFRDAFPANNTSNHWKGRWNYSSALFMAASARYRMDSP